MAEKQSGHPCNKVGYQNSLATSVGLTWNGCSLAQGIVIVIVAEGESAVLRSVANANSVTLYVPVPTE